LAAVTDDHGSFGVDRQVEVLVRQFSLLSPGDRDLVMALVARLEGSDQLEVYPKDVPFMDFDE
jgi:hypothetical protein